MAVTWAMRRVSASRSLVGELGLVGSPAGVFWWVVGVGDKGFRLRFCGFACAALGCAVTTIQQRERTGTLATGFVKALDLEGQYMQMRFSFVGRHVIAVLLACWILAGVAAGCDDEKTEQQPQDTGNTIDTENATDTITPDTHTADTTTTLDTPTDTPDTPNPTDRAQVLADYSLSGGFFSAPFPDESRRTATGGVNMAGYPNPTNNVMVSALTDIVGDDVDGFGVMSAVYFPLSADIDPQSLGDWQASLEANASAYLVSVDAGKPDYLRRYPITTMYEPDAGPYGAKHMLSLLPIQGTPLAEQTLYAAVITSRVQDAEGQPLEASESLALLRAGTRPPGMSDGAWTAYQEAFVALQEAGQNADDIVGLAVFRTGSPSAGLRQAWEQVKVSPLPALPTTWQADEVFDTFCVFSASIDMPTFQAGEPPFTSEGGDWRWDSAGMLTQQGTERARIVVTLPRAIMPDNGFPLAVFIRTGGGGDRPLVDRGVRGSDGIPLEQGSGPAKNLSFSHIAGLSIDGPHGGLRNITGGDEQFLIFNIQNPIAMRDNIRQSALELALLAELLDTLTLDPAVISGCSGLDTAGQPARFDISHLALMGHSMGATIAPLVLAIQPRYRAAVLSGAGGSWIANIVHKKKPLEVAPLAEAILGYRNRRLHMHDPALSLLQWAGEAADPPIYAAHIIRKPWSGAPRHVLMFQGIADTYILPPMANAPHPHARPRRDKSCPRRR